MSTIPLPKARDLAMLFHLNSEPWMNQQAYNDPSVLHSFRTVETADPVIPLPPVESTPVFDVIRSRYSCRHFADAAMPLEVLAALLHQGYGVLGLRDADGVSVHHRPVPSAGALFPLELYAVIHKVNDLQDGVYHYAAWNHRLECLKPGIQFAELLPNLQEQHYILGANILLFITAVFSRTMTKYGPRGYRYIFLEAGHVAQNVCLLAAERKLGTLCLGGFRDAYINDLLQLNPRNEGALYGMAIGQPLAV
jgi:SagB-type dehydrogenase family enzyme